MDVINGGRDRGWDRKADHSGRILLNLARATGIYAGIEMRIIDVDFAGIDTDNGTCRIGVGAN